MTTMTTSSDGQHIRAITLVSERRGTIYQWIADSQREPASRVSFVVDADGTAFVRVPNEGGFPERLQLTPGDWWVDITDSLPATITDDRS